MESAGVELEAAPTAASESRQWAAPVLRSWGLDSVCDDVLFVVGELVANAVLHTRTPPTLRLHHEAHRLRIEVEDRAMFTEPSEDDPPPTALCGRGLHIVGELSGDWGSDLIPGGKVVWAEIPVQI